MLSLLSVVDDRDVESINFPAAHLTRPSLVATSCRRFEHLFGFVSPRSHISFVVCLYLHTALSQDNEHKISENLVVYAKRIEAVCTEKQEALDNGATSAAGRYMSTVEGSRSHSRRNSSSSLDQLGATATTSMAGGALSVGGGLGGSSSLGGGGGGGGGVDSHQLVPHPSPQASSRRTSIESPVSPPKRSFVSEASAESPVSDCFLSIFLFVSFFSAVFFFGISI